MALRAACGRAGGAGLRHRPCRGRSAPSVTVCVSLQEPRASKCPLGFFGDNIINNASAEALTTVPSTHPAAPSPRGWIREREVLLAPTRPSVPLKGPSKQLRPGRPAVCRGGSRGDSPEQQGLRTSAGHASVRSPGCCPNAASSRVLCPAGKATPGRCHICARAA